MDTGAAVERISEDIGSMNRDSCMAASVVASGDGRAEPLGGRDSTGGVQMRKAYLIGYCTFGLVISLLFSTVLIAVFPAVLFVCFFLIGSEADPLGPILFCTYIAFTAVSCGSFAAFYVAQSRARTMPDPPDRLQL